MFSKNTISTLLSVIISHTPPLRVLEVHINGFTGITIHITESKIHISYSENHDSTLFFYYFHMPSIPTLAHTIDKGSTFSISSPFDVTKYKIKNHFGVSSIGSFPCPMSMGTPMVKGTQLGFKWHRESDYSSQCSQKIWFRHYHQ